MSDPYCSDLEWLLMWCDGELGASGFNPESAGMSPSTMVDSDPFQARAMARRAAVRRSRPLKLRWEALPLWAKVALLRYYEWRPKRPKIPHPEMVRIREAHDLWLSEVVR